MTEIIDEPGTLGDFLYGYSHGISCDGLIAQFNIAIRAIRELRRRRAFVDLNLEDQLLAAFEVRAERQGRRKQQPLPLFCSDLDLNEWLSTQRSYARAWHQCERGDWLLLIAISIEVDHKLVVRAGCDCARTALRYVPKGEDRPRIAIETAEAWCDGQAAIEQVLCAVDDANAVGSISDGAAYAASAAVHATRAASVVHAVRAASAASAAYSVDYFKALKQHADLVRSRIPWSVVRDEIRTKEHRRLP